MRVALSEYRIDGIKTNIALHHQILNDPEFLAGNIHTRYLDKSLNRRPTARDSAATAQPMAGHA